MINRSEFIGGSDTAAIHKNSGRTPRWVPVIDSESKNKEISYATNYLIYEDGRVFSKKNNKFLVINITSRGYAHVKLGCDKWKSIHRLVAEAFIKNLENKLQVNHIDGNPLNNHVSNLELVTQRENMIHAYRTGIAKAPTWSDERKKRQSERLKGRKVPVEVREKISKSKFGKKIGTFSLEHRKKISEAIKKYHARRSNGQN